MDNSLVSLPIISEVYDFLTFKERSWLGTTCKDLSKLDYHKVEYYCYILGLHNNILYITQRIGIYKYHQKVEVVRYEFTKGNMVVKLRFIDEDRSMSINLKSATEFCNNFSIEPHKDSIEVVRTTDGRFVIILGNYDSSFGSSLKTGDYLDALDDEGCWQEAVVKSVSENTVGIHYRCWSDKYDSQLTKDSPRIAPPYTHTQDWRSQLKVGASICVLKERVWVPLKVASTGNGKISYTYRDRDRLREKNTISVYTADVQSDPIAPAILHTQKKAFFATHGAFSKKYTSGDSLIAWDIYRNGDEFIKFKP